MIQQERKGFTWISLLTILVILSMLLMAGASHWATWRVKQAKHVLFHDIARALAFTRAEALLRGETLELSPVDFTGNWALGIRLYPIDEKNTAIKTWQWQLPDGMQLTWHGFLGQDKLVVNAKPESLAMNGYFLLENTRLGSEQWVVSRLGRMRVLRKHVA
ncbi:MAG: hypothetical protein K0U24_04075 [Gammaproteobacteria bacterium]|nr:hypothetical protein [Gammaproteobacteria bacterium]MCH9763391.1 hypothetical protein [Gammaproteobacteria bacterium]